MNLERIVLRFKAALITYASRKDPFFIDEYPDGSKTYCIGRGYDDVGFKNGSGYVDTLPIRGTVFLRDPRGEVRLILSTEKFASANIKIGSLEIVNTTLTGLLCKMNFMIQEHENPKYLEIKTVKSLKSKTGDPSGNRTRDFRDESPTS